MKTIAVIPIRAGSKGLSNKNVLFLQNKPLVGRTIEALLESKCVNPKDIFIATDSSEYISFLKKWYPQVSYYKRTPENAKDTSTTAEFLVEFLSVHGGYETLVLCQATSPLRTGFQIKSAFKSFLDNDERTVVSITKNGKPDELHTRLGDNGELCDIVGIDVGYRRQTFTNKYIPNGAIYITNIIKYLDTRSFFMKDTLGFMMSDDTSIDIDTETDLKIAKTILCDREENFFSSRLDLIFENKELLIKNKRILLADGRDSHLIIDAKAKDFYYTRLFEKITIHEIVELIKANLLNQCTNIIISAGLFDLEKSSIDEIYNNIEYIIKWGRKLKVSIVVCEIAPTLYRAEYNNESIEQINKFFRKKLTMEGFSCIQCTHALDNKKNLDYRITNDGIRY